ncbi:MAG: antitoxin family protein [Phototrophicales bacterium]|nr:antitoxin family protein [Phototrophicales bacterium]
MTISVNAIYENGQLHLDESIDLSNGQRVRVKIEPIQPNHIDTIKAIFGDSVIWSSDNDDSDSWIESQAHELRELLSKGQSLSELIVEERQNQP